jgi:hypothetical protein
MPSGSAWIQSWKFLCSRLGRSFCANMLSSGHGGGSVFIVTARQALEPIQHFEMIAAMGQNVKEARSATLPHVPLYIRDVMLLHDNFIYFREENNSHKVKVFHFYILYSLNLLTYFSEILYASSALKVD